MTSFPIGVRTQTRGVHYVGDKACVECHAAQAVQLNTPMSQALEVAPDCRIITACGSLKFKNGKLPRLAIFNPGDLSALDLSQSFAARVTLVSSRRCCCRVNQALTTFVFNRIACSIVKGTTQMIRGWVVSPSTGSRHETLFRKGDLAVSIFRSESSQVYDYALDVTWRYR